MRFLFPVLIGLSLSASHTTTLQKQPDDLWITIKPSDAAGGSAAVRVLEAQIYVGGPSASVGVPGRVAAPELMFSVRAWKEADKARVVVYARLEDKRAPEGSTETPIATFSVAANDVVEVRETEKWGAGPLSVSAAFR